MTTQQPPPPPVAISISTTTVTILGLGSLLSERSSRTTFPALTNFRLGRVSKKYRRVFSHPASIFFQRGLVANIETKEFSSLSAEEIDFESEGEGFAPSLYRGGFVCSVFEVPREEIFLNDEVDEEEEIEEDSDENNIKGRTPKPKPTGEFLEREEEFDIVQVEFVELNKNNADEDNNGSCSSTTIETVTNTNTTTGVLCTRFTDEGYIKRWGMERFNQHYTNYGIDTIWGYNQDSGIRPCRVYLRHCYLAAKSMGPLCLKSFLDETFLCDRTTTIRQYLEKNQNENYNIIIQNTIPPPGFEERYSG